MTVNLISIGGRDVSTSPGLVSLSKQDCVDNVDLVYELRQIPGGHNAIDVYAGTNCNSTDRKNTTTTDCKVVTSEQLDGAVSNFTITLKAKAAGCDDGTTKQLFFLAVQSAGSTEDVGSDWAMYSLDIDTTGPAAPSNLKGGRGESEIPIEWESSDSDVQEFILFIDPSPTDGNANADFDGGAAGVGGGDDCGSSVLKEGADSFDLPASIKQKRVGSATSSGTKLKPEDLEGDRVAIAVVAIDEAGNRSALSEVVCVYLVPTDGFWERYEQEGGAAATGCPCSAVGEAQLHTAWPVMLALLAVRRGPRRRRQR